MRQLLQAISTNPQLKQSKDSILLAEDEYPDVLDAIFTRLTHPTSLQNTINLLQWDRKAGGSYDAELKATTISSQTYMRSTNQLTPTIDNPWDTYTFRKWKHFVTNFCACQRYRKLLKQVIISKRCSIYSHQTDLHKQKELTTTQRITCKVCSYIIPCCCNHHGKLQII